MLKTIVVLLLLVTSTASQAEELVSTLSWEQAKEKGLLRSGEISDTGVLTIAATTDGRNALILELPEPGITSPVYALKGMIRYAGVTDTGFLQMDSHFEGKGAFFTKGLAPDGPLRNISGDVDWRPFLLPFFANTDDQASQPTPLPNQISLSLHLPGSGTVSLKDVALYQYAPGENPIAGAAGVFDRSIGLFGAVGGALIGFWGAIIGTLSGLGRGRKFVMTSIHLFGAIGAVSLLGAVIGFLTSQPSQLSYTLALFGIILLALLATRGAIRARYESLELRKMKSIDAGV